MDAFTRVEGVVCPLDRADVDTDQIIPKQFLKRIERTGFGEFLFWDWRGEEGFPLDRPEYAGAPILVTGRNFGCGSSREHAPWALEDHGFRADHRAELRRHLPHQLHQDRPAAGRAPRGRGARAHGAGDGRAGLDRRGRPRAPGGRRGRRARDPLRDRPGHARAAAERLGRHRPHPRPRGRHRPLRGASASATGRSRPRSREAGFSSPSSTGGLDDRLPPSDRGARDRPSCEGSARRRPEPRGTVARRATGPLFARLLGSSEAPTKGTRTGVAGPHGDEWRSMSCVAIPFSRDRQAAPPTSRGRDGRRRRIVVPRPHPRATGDP